MRILILHYALREPLTRIFSSWWIASCPMYIDYCYELVECQSLNSHTARRKWIELMKNTWTAGYCGGLLWVEYARNALKTLNEVAFSCNCLDNWLAIDELKQWIITAPFLVTFMRYQQLSRPRGVRSVEAWNFPSWLLTTESHVWEQSFLL